MCMIWFCFVGADHLAVGPAAGGHELRRRQLSARLGHAVGHHPAPPDVLGADPVALPELEHHQRRADLFAGQQLEVRQFLAGADADARVCVAR